jgi:hypothetical protein
LAWVRWRLIKIYDISKIILESNFVEIRSSRPYQVYAQIIFPNIKPDVVFDFIAEVAVKFRLTNYYRIDFGYSGFL